MATGKKQNGRWPFPKKAKLKAIHCHVKLLSPILRLWALGDFLWSKSIRVGVGGRKAWGLWQLTLDPGNGGIVSLPALQQASIGASSAACWYLCTLWYLVVLVNFGNCSPVSTMADLLALGCPCLCRGVHGCLWVSIRAPFLLMAARS